MDPDSRRTAVIISAGTGHNIPDLRWELDADTVDVNVLGFMAMAHVSMRHLFRRGHGHLSVYLDGLRDLAGQRGRAIVVTEVQPGAVDTAP